MKRVLILGCPGAGKTYFSKKLADTTGLPLIHMDNLYWNKDKTCVSREELLKKIEPILAQEEWILDGNYHHTLEVRLERCTDVFFLDLSRTECANGVRERIGKVRDDIPWVETKEDAEELIDWTKDYLESKRPYELELLAKHPEIKITVFYSRNEINEYLEGLNEKI